MSKSEVLRRMLLDGHGVQYESDDCRHSSNTKWSCDLGEAEFYEDHTNGYTSFTLRYEDGMTSLEIESDLTHERHVTPGQAIEATLGVTESQDEIGRLVAENSKLRALLIDAYAEFIMTYGDADARREYADRMRELGIGGRL